ncbi:hypothetical protein M406DRAFT_328339 [Cryphonectria parasitica EP155]|uniref:SNF2 N-terminal domain-containing protein n=1 Tax=Cryphonectria parasitica (strain ATCC 38755 / EP155) TaxID=660469 RepID=A0A9P4Y6B1_CRYP1|nr:uncharacterized protein M406DRAFT_328339 [Cryphonectria parasitica EP155]KAF3767249.1 hypothetical protein M406DRAFT_328339 [Cryphonectria parasitica EP155]
MDRDPTDHKPKRRRVDEGYDVSPLIASIEDTQQSYNSSNHFVSKDRSCDIQGRIISEHEQMIQGLLDEKSLDLQVFCAVEESPTSNKPDRAFTQCPCSLSIVVFGALDLLEEIGSWLQEYDVYLQDPVNVSEQYSGLRYCNPHRLSFEQPGSCSLVREVSAQNSRLLGFQEIGNQPDLLDLLSNHAHLEEAPQPTATRTSLKKQVPEDEKHQRQALTFMMKREKGWAFREDGDIWESPSPQLSSSFHRHFSVLGKNKYQMSAEWKKQEKLFWMKVSVRSSVLLTIYTEGLRFLKLVQNRLDDLASLLKFIRAYPYHDLKQSKADISNPWKSGDDEKGIQRLKYLSASLVLRRPKTTISLPCRRDLKYPVEFSRQEREAYEAIRGQAIMNIDEALQSGSDPSKGVAYVNVLQQIESLRLFCNLGLHYYIRHDLSKRLNDSWEAVAQQTFNAQREMDPVSCLHCSSSLEVTESLLDPVDGKGEGKFFRCMQFCCGECVGKIQRSRAEVACSHSPPCPGATVTLIGQAVEEIASLQTLHPRTGLDLPSKIQALVTDIKCLPKETKW